MGLHFRITFAGVDADTFVRACNRVEGEVKALINRAVRELTEGGRMAKKVTTDDLSDILGDSPSTTKEKSMSKDAKAAAAKAAVKASAAKAQAKGTPAAVAKVKPVAKPAKAAPKKAAKGGEGKFHFPVGTPEREAVKKRVLAAVNKAKSISTKDLAKQLDIETFKVRLVSVELEGEKAIKREKDGNAFTLKAK